MSLDNQENVSFNANKLNATANLCKKSTKQKQNKSKAKGGKVINPSNKQQDANKSVLLMCSNTLKPMSSNNHNHKH